MTRRDFFRRLFPLRDNAPSPGAEVAAVGANEEVRELFLEAMRLGIDPATVDPRFLRRLVASRGCNPSTTEEDGASGSDLAGHPDAPRRPQQRGGPDGDKRQGLFVP